MKEKRSFFERLTGAVRVQDDTEEETSSRRISVDGDTEEIDMEMVMVSSW